MVRNVLLSIIILLSVGTAWGQEVNLNGLFITSVKFITKKSVGSGVIWKQGYVLTAGHVCRDWAIGSYVVTTGGRRYPVSYVMFDNKKHDFCVAKVADTPPSWNIIQPTIGAQPKTQENVWCAGWARGNDYVLNIGHMLWEREELVPLPKGGVGKWPSAVVSNKIIRGQSGGGCINAKGELIGIVSFFDTHLGGGMVSVDVMLKGIKDWGPK